jgi:hypothetical protein
MSGFDDQERLSDALHQRVKDLDGHPIGLDTVKSSARRIRRRRVAGGVVAAAAVLAVAVPTGVALTGTSTDGTGPVAQGTASATASASEATSASAAPTPSPSITQQASPSPTATTALPPGVTPLTLDGTPAGAAPKLTYLDGRTVHTDGAATELPARYAAVVGYHGGWLAQGMGNDGPTIVHIDGTGKVTSTAPGGYGIAVNGDGTLVAWVEDGVLKRGIASGMGEGEDTQKLPAGQDARVIGFAANDVVYSLPGDKDTVHATDLNGHDRVLSGLIGARATHDFAGLVGGETRYNSDGTSCWVLRDLASGKDRFEECDWALQAVGPDAKYVVGVPSDCDGLGCSRLAVLDATSGKVVKEFASTADAQLFTTDLAWEDETHLLAVAFQQGTWQILRLGVDGSVETTVSGAQAADTDGPYHLGSHS